ncbi:hypothetical protein FF021_15395 [Leptospira noguchii]|nr:hypothetical protein FF021_15395 [Leptospira noguchii]
MIRYIKNKPIVFKTRNSNNVSKEENINGHLAKSKTYRKRSIKIEYKFYYKLSRKLIIFIAFKLLRKTWSLVKLYSLLKGIF